MSRHRVKCLMLTYSPCVYRVLTVNLPPRLSHRVGECRSFLLPLLSLNVTESRGYMASNLFRTRFLHITPTSLPTTSYTGAPISRAFHSSVSHPRHSNQRLLSWTACQLLCYRYLLGIRPKAQTQRADRARKSFVWVSSRWTRRVNEEKPKCKCASLAY